MYVQVSTQHIPMYLKLTCLQLNILHENDCTVNFTGYWLRFYVPLNTK